MSFISFNTRTYGTRISLKSQGDQRLAECFESYEDTMKHESSKKRRPCRPIEKMNFNKVGLLHEVESYNDTVAINYSDLARKYNVLNSKGKPAKNGGQIIKEYLKEQNICLNQFHYNGKGRHSNNSEMKQIRKRKLKITGGYSIPCDEAISKTKQKLREDIESGKYSLGEPIVPKEYKKLTEESFTIYGRQIHLKLIPIKLLKNELKYMREQPNFDAFNTSELLSLHKEVVGKPVESITMAKNNLELLSRTRHLQVWHDNSTIANHGYFMVTVNTCYDRNIHFTRDKYKAKTGINIDIQTAIEQPELHILTKASSSIDDQLLHSATRLACIQDITSEIELPHGRKLIDKIRFFHGDNPSAQLEAGHQKGGNYFCPTCPIKATETYCLQKCYRTDVETLKMKQEKVLKGPVASSNIKIGKFPFTGLSKENLVTELCGRGLIKDSYQDKKKYGECSITRTLWDEDGACFTLWE